MRVMDARNLRLPHKVVWGAQSALQTTILVSNRIGTRSTGVRFDGIRLNIA